MRYLRVVSIAALLTAAPTCQAFADLQIIFYSDREGRPIFDELRNDLRGLEVFVMNPDGSNPVNLTKQIGVETLPSVSPDKTKYLFSSNRTGDNEIFAVNFDGSNLVNLTNDPAGSDSRPRWSPDGTKILWHRWPAAVGVEIFVMNADGSDKHNLGRGFRPEWSPDGKMIGFTLDGRPDNAFVMNTDGGGRRRVTDDLTHTRFISWSPDGTKIALREYTPFGFKQRHIYVVNLDGTGLVELTKDLPNFDCYGAAWSPDSTKIAFYRLEGHTQAQIYVVNADGTDPTRLTGPPTTSRRPSWSPDGSKIAFGSSRDGVDDIYLMNADGSNQINLTNHPANDRLPSWIRIDSPTTSFSPQDSRLTTWGQIKHGNQ
ncbi:MAG: hypothetical protein OXT74_11220 [Candidatus Poribacteria bacterium]|nr:hypothetical protein [Candidatus Poribacteria bacterium]